MHNALEYFLNVLEEHVTVPQFSNLIWRLVTYLFSIFFSLYRWFTCALSTQIMYKLCVTIII